MNPWGSLIRSAATGPSPLEFGEPSRLRVPLDCLAVIQDAREARRVAYPLAELLLLAACGPIVDCDDCDVIVDRAAARYGPPQIFNTDQGGQYTSPRFVEVLKDTDVPGSMDGRRRWMDNAPIERPWRSPKCECVYIHTSETGSELRAGLTRWIPFGTTRPLPGPPSTGPIGKSMRHPFRERATDGANPEHKLAA